MLPQIKNKELYIETIIKVSGNKTPFMVGCNLLECKFIFKDKT